MYPGDMITTECWRIREDFIQFRVRVKERKTFAINQGYVLLKKIEQHIQPQGIANNDSQNVFNSIENSLKSMNEDKRKKLLEKVL